MGRLMSKETMQVRDTILILLKDIYPNTVHKKDLQEILLAGLKDKYTYPRYLSALNHLIRNDKIQFRDNEMRLYETESMELKRGMMELQNKYNDLESKFVSLAAIVCGAGRAIEQKLGL
jgi:hypothetical protein